MKQMPAPINATFFDALVREMSQKMGPIADAILDDEIERLGVTRSDFPVDRVTELVQNISDLFASREQQIQFQQVMLESFQRL